MECSAPREDAEIFADIPPHLIRRIEPSLWLGLSSKLLLATVVVLSGAFYLWAAWTSSSRPRPHRDVQGMSRRMLAVLGITMCLDFFCTDQYQPSMPDMAADFNVPSVAMGSTIQLHLFTSAIGMSLLGPLSDLIGRKPVIVGSQAPEISKKLVLAWRSGLLALITNLSRVSESKFIQIVISWISRWCWSVV